MAYQKYSEHSSLMARAGSKTPRVWHYWCDNPPEDPKIWFQLYYLTKLWQLIERAPGIQEEIAWKLEKDPKLAIIELWLIWERNRLLEQSGLSSLNKQRLMHRFMPSDAISILKSELVEEGLFGQIADSWKSRLLMTTLKYREGKASPDEMLWILRCMVKSISQWFKA